MKYLKNSAWQMIIKKKTYIPGYIQKIKLLYEI